MDIKLYRYIVKGVEKGYILKIKNFVKINVHSPLNTRCVHHSLFIINTNSYRSALEMMAVNGEQNSSSRNLWFDFTL